MSPDDPSPAPGAQRLSPEMEAYFEAVPEPDLDDPDNPEWTEADFARAKGPESLPPEVLAAFPRTVAALEAHGKAPPGLVSLALDLDVVEHFKAEAGDEWRPRINAVLRAAMRSRPGEVA